MAFVPFFIFGPTALTALIGFIHGPDRTVPTPKEDWRAATVDLLIPSFNEDKTIVLCLASIKRQTLQPRQIILYDDDSDDTTIENAKLYAKYSNINLKIISKKNREGKTRALFHTTYDSDADVLAIVDADTLLISDNYLERLVQELYQGVGIASACGVVQPLTEQDRNLEFQVSHLDAFAKANPKIEYSPDRTAFEKLQRAITNAYREELYLFLEQYIYHGEMVFLGTVIFPVGCAVVYRREYLKDLFDFYTKYYGLDLTTSEDIFFGFAFANKGFRNVVVRDVEVHTKEPRIGRLFPQIFKWSSSFLQSCYYFNNLFFTPLKFPKLFIKKIKDTQNEELKKLKEKRKIKEAYRQAFGTDYTKKYGRNIGWFIFFTALEKLSYPTVMLILIILKFWTTLVVTFILEQLLFVIVITTLYKKKRIRNAIKATLFAPIRYGQIMFDLIVASKFMVDLWLTKNRHWRK